ncbi:reverse transcriptase [Paramuricea clavata]|uniref:Reverse transcriptase n=1 Tax=Paramuricea clavata TaxID=317549 RepID=A0A6S7K1T7_PARCT|nr:reverse transcriptase [Paramuricea clavata]
MSVRCEECGGSFKSGGALASHIKWKHPNVGQPRQEVVSEVKVCPDCGVGFKGDRGLNGHRRSAHPDVYHAARQPAARVKARWSHEELVLIARAELELRRTKPRQGIVRALHSRFPDRSFEAIKCVRTKNPRYKELLVALEAEEAVREFAEMEAADSSRFQPGVPSPSSDGDVGWGDQLRMSINIEHLGVDSLDWVVEGCPDQRVRNKLDEVFALWVGHLARGERAPVRDPQTSASSTNPDRSSSLDSRRRRRAQYSAIQQLYSRKPSACAHKVLDGSWVNPNPGPSPTLQQFCDTWQPIFETPSIKDSRRPTCIGQVRWDILRPVTPEELKPVLTEGASSAPGPDGVKLKQVIGLGMEELCSHYNLWLLCGSQPSALCTGRTIFLPKGSESSDALKYRPITIASHILRVFHKIMARRCDAILPLKHTQKGFRRGDGIAQHVFTLQSIIDGAKSELRPLNLVFLDVRKAFDSVSHDTIVQAMRRLGCPDPFLAYIGELYSRSSTVLEHNGEKSATIFTRRGVKQGDPLSPFLFNAVIDWAFSSLDDHLGYSFGNIRVNNLGYADDVALLSETKAGLRVQLGKFESHLLKGGLEISAGTDGKSASMSIAVDGKAKRWVIDHTPFLATNSGLIPSMSATGEYRYLGIMLGAGGAKVRGSLRKDLVQGLGNISRAPLKPHQRLVILRNFLMPKYLHELVLAPVGDGWLRWLDTTIRANVRQWLKLPKDTPIAFFHARVADGGLGVTSLRYSIPVLRRNRLEAVCSAVDPLSRALVDSSFFQEALNRLPSKILDGRLVTDKQSLAQAWAASLYTKVDGRGLSEARSCAAASGWVYNPPRNQSGANYIGAIKARGGLLLSKVRSARGDPGRDVSCDSCMRPETAQHIVQVCPRTSGPRIRRHDRVVKFVSAAAERAGYKVMVEPRIVGRTLGVRKPDLVLWNDRKAYVADVTVTSDQVGGVKAHRDKVAYYDQPEIREWVSNLTGVADISFSAVAANWRGVLSSLSADFLKSVLKLSNWDLSVLGLRICEDTFHVHRSFGRCTYRVRS